MTTTQAAVTTAAPPPEAPPVDRTSRRAALEEAILPAVVALLVAAIVGDILILTFGQSPGTVYRLLLEGTWGNAYGLGQVLYKATTLTFTGLAVAIGPVSYTHLRAHETPEHLVCRLLLEKKKKKKQNTE